jgi:hypothetical protein
MLGAGGLAAWWFVRPRPRVFDESYTSDTTSVGRYHAGDVVNDQILTGSGMPGDPWKWIPVSYRAGDIKRVAGFGTYRLAADGVTWLPVTDAGTLKTLGLA